MIAQIANLLSLGFLLSLDNFRTSILLGPLRLTWVRVVQVALWFGLWDAVSPLAGLLAGHYIGAAIGPIADYVGPGALAAYGLFLLIQARRSRGAEPEEMEHSWTLFSLPVPLSVDNFIGGTSLGLLGFSPWLSAPVFGAITAVMSFIGLLLGRMATRLLSRRIHIRFDVVTGVGLLIEALVLGLLAVFGGGD